MPKKEVSKALHTHKSSINSLNNSFKSERNKGKAKPKDEILREVETELASLKKEESEILKRLSKDEELERQILKDLENRRNRETDVKRFSFADFGQVVVGAVVFGLPAMWTPDFWNFINGLDSVPPLPIPMYKILAIHIFILFCVFITLNYAFRKTFRFERHFFAELSRRIFYIYLTVTALMLMFLWAFNKLSPDMSTLDFLRYLLATNSVGLVGAVTFDFLID